MLIASVFGALCAATACSNGADGAANKETVAAAASDDADTASDATAIARTVYTAFAAGDMETFTGLMAPDIVWMEAEGNPYADLNPYEGPDAVMTGLIGRLVAEWDDFSVTPEEFVTEGNRVIVFGRYRETWKQTGKRIDIPFVHSWTIENSKIIAFQQYTDTATLAATMAE
jgi:ketosteroid isomerase-like protein